MQPESVVSTAVVVADFKVMNGDGLHTFMNFGAWQYSTLLWTLTSSILTSFGPILTIGPSHASN
jgi:hypothetical protein